MHAAELIGANSGPGYDAGTSEAFRLFTDTVAPGNRSRRIGTNHVPISISCVVLGKHYAVTYDCITVYDTTRSLRRRPHRSKSASYSIFVDLHSDLSSFSLLTFASIYLSFRHGYIQKSRH